MRSIHAVTLLSLLLAGPALADGARLTGLPAALLSGDAAEGTQHELPNPPAPNIAAGSTTILLGETLLGDLNSAFGGTLRQAGDGSVSAQWLCYDVGSGDKAQILWFVSDGKAGGSTHKVTLVGAAFGPARPDCDTAPASLTGLTVGAPGLGASESDLQAAFGTVAARNGMVAYLNQSAAAKGGSSEFQSLNYLIKGNVIVGLAVGQIAAP